MLTCYCCSLPQASNGDTLQLCAGLEPSAEGSVYGSCPKTIKWGGSTFLYKQQENDVDKLRSCGEVVCPHGCNQVPRPPAG